MGMLSAKRDVPLLLRTGAWSVVISIWIAVVTQEPRKRFARSIPLRKREGHNVVALLRAAFAVAARGNDHVLFALHRVRHGGGLAAGPELEFPELLAGFGIQG